MGLFIMIGVCALDIIMAVAIITFFIDAIDNKFWRMFIFCVAMILLFNVFGILFII